MVKIAKLRFNAMLDQMLGKLNKDTGYKSATPMKYPVFPAAGPQKKQTVNQSSTLENLEARMVIAMKSPLRIEGRV